MGASSADDVGKTENPCLHSEGAHPTADEAFTGLFAGAVEGDGHARTVIFWCWERCILPINHRTGCKSNFLNTCDTHGFEDVVGGDGSLLEIGVRDTCAKANIWICSEMEHTINVLGHGFLNVIGVANIALDHGDRPRINVLLDEGSMTA